MLNLKDKKVVVGIIQTKGVSQKVGATTTVTVVEKDSAGLVSRAKGGTLPSAEAGYAVNCVFYDTTAKKAYMNLGTTASCTFTELQIGEIVEADLAANSVTSAKIKDGEIIDADINASAAIAHTKLANITAGRVLMGNATNVPTATAISGDIGVSNTGVASITADSIVDADINTAAAIADTKLGTIATALKVSNSATTATNLNTASAIVARDASGNFVAGTMTGNITGNAATVTTNANLTGDVTSVGNATTVVTNANLTGDITSVGNATTASPNLKADLATIALMGTVAEFSFPFNAEVNTEQAATFLKSYDAGTTAYVDVATSSGSALYTANYQLFPDTEVENDAVLFGAATKFGVMYIDVSATVAVYNADSLTWEYWNGTAWVALTIIYDHTDSTAQNGLRSFQRDGHIIFSAPIDWASDTIDGQSAFWVRARCNATVDITTIPLLDAHEHYLITDPVASELPASGTIGRARVSFITPSGAAADTNVILCNLSSGACSAITTLTKALQSNEVANFALPVTAGDGVAFYITQEEGTTEFANGFVELNILKA